MLDNTNSFPLDFPKPQSFEPVLPLSSLWLRLVFAVLLGGGEGECMFECWLCEIAQGSYKAGPSKDPNFGQSAWPHARPKYGPKYGPDPMVGYRLEVPVLVLVSLQNVPYCTVSFFKGSLNNTKHCEVILY